MITEKQKEYQKKYYYSNKGKKKRKEHRKTEEYKKNEKEYQKKYDKTKKRKEKIKIRIKIRNKFVKGEIKKNKCQRCKSKEKLEFHHLDYNKPYEVLILCHNCHILEHRKLKEFERGLK